MVRSGAVDIVIVDSVAALVPKAEIDGDMGDSHVGLQARLMSQALRKLTPVVSKNNCVVIFINQLREKVGVMFGIRLPLHSEKQSLIFFLEKVYLQKEILLILLLMQVLSRRVEHGSHMRAIRLDRDERTLSSSFLIIQR